MFTKNLIADLIILVIVTAVLAYCDFTVFTGVWVTIGYVLTAIAALLMVAHAVGLIVPEFGDAIIS